MKTVVVRSFLTILFLVSLTATSFSHSPAASITYRLQINARDLSGFDVEMRITNLSRNSRSHDVLLAMASHTEYDDEYWRYVENLSATSGASNLAITREENALWRVPASGSQLVVKYRIHLPVETESFRFARKPFLTSSGGIVGDQHSFMYVVGMESAHATVSLDMPDGWKSACGLDTTSDPNKFAATSVELLLDSPIVVGNFRQWNFTVDGIAHQVAYLDQAQSAKFDNDALVTDLQKLVRQAFELAGKPPYKHFTFIFLDGAEGGLEHLTSLVIGAPAARLAQELSGTLDTVAHEYFHTWNLMHVRPVERVGLQYRPVKPTGELWWGEGVTLYFADLMLRRSLLPTSDATRAKHLESLIASYLFNPAYASMSAERVSAADNDPVALGDFGASTHLQGNVLGSMLDLIIMDATAGRRSLSDVMRLLSARFDYRRGVTSRDIERTVHEVCSCDVRLFFDSYVRNAGAVDFDRYLKLIGMRAEVSWNAAVDRDGNQVPDLRVFLLDGQKLKITNPKSAWGRAGLHTGDKLVSLNGNQINAPAEFRSMLGRLHVNDKVTVEIVRQGQTMTVPVTVTSYERPTVKIEELIDATPSQKNLRAQWVSFAKDKQRLTAN